MPRRRIVLLTAAAVAALALPVAADRITQQVLEHRVATQLGCALGLSSPPEVTLGGLPFLTQLGARQLSEARISADQVTVKRVTSRRSGCGCRPIGSAHSAGRTLSRCRSCPAG
ncbi:DUF2993 domain-containing protein [Actinoplanes sp. N902-109]|uniref:LmeA family phospholipid-binding protein n=1 Tax=Actinoplanes sp. (strain N902-109) TaxID=649831 RepID=UPI0003AA3729|nr:DUF2993 domain-containing protein [Actinoplanes sp. N902-109]